MDDNWDVVFFCEVDHGLENDFLMLHCNGIHARLADSNNPRIVYVFLHELDAFVHLSHGQSPHGIGDRQIQVKDPKIVGVFGLFR